MAKPDPVMKKLRTTLAAGPGEVYAAAWFSRHHDDFARQISEWTGRKVDFWRVIAEHFGSADPPIVGRHGQKPSGPGLQKVWERHIAKRARSAPQRQPPEKAQMESKSPRPKFIGIGQARKNK